MPLLPHRRRRRAPQFPTRVNKEGPPQQMCEYTVRQ